MDMATAVNAPIEIEIGGRKFRARQVTLGELFGHFEGQARTDAIASAQEMAAGLPAGDKHAFLAEAWRALPRGKALMDLAREAMETPRGIGDIHWLALRRDNAGLTRADVDAMLTNDELSNISRLVMHLTGVGDIAPKPDAPTEQAEGNAAGRLRPPEA